ncbi:MAG: helix-turn-helix domain-containing protein, partial [Pseudomonadota bacterium]
MRKDKLFIGPKLRRLRQSLGLTQTRMAQELEISPSYLNLIEGNQRPVSAALLIRLTQNYDVPLDELSGTNDVALVADLYEALRDPRLARAIPKSEVEAVVAASPAIAAAKSAGIRVMTGHGIAHVKGGKRVTGVGVCAQAGEGAVLEEIACDAVAMPGGWSPVVHLWSHCGGKLVWDADGAMFRPDVDKPPTGADGAGFVSAAGASNGAFDLGALLADAQAAGKTAAEATGHTSAAVAAYTVADGESGDAPMAPVWLMPQGAGAALRAKAWLDYQNDVKVSDVQLAAQEGFESVEHAKRYTTLGMATDQGKLSNINGLAVLANELGTDIPAVGTTTFRP